MKPVSFDAQKWWKFFIRIFLLEFRNRNSYFAWPHLLTNSSHFLPVNLLYVESTADFLTAFFGNENVAFDTQYLMFETHIITLK